MFFSWINRHNLGWNGENRQDICLSSSEHSLKFHKSACGRVTFSYVAQAVAGGSS